MKRKGNKLSAAQTAKSSCVSKIAKKSRPLPRRSSPRKKDALKVSALPAQTFVLALLPLILMFAAFIYAVWVHDAALMKQVVGYIPHAIWSALGLSGGIAAQKVFGGFFRS